MIFIIGALVVLLVLNFIAFARCNSLQTKINALTHNTHTAMLNVNQKVDFLLLTPEDRESLGLELPAMSKTPAPKPKKKAVDKQKVCKQHDYSAEYVGKINLKTNLKYSFDVDGLGQLRTCYKCQNTVVKGKNMDGNSSWFLDGFR